MSFLPRRACPIARRLAAKGSAEIRTARDDLSSLLHLSKPLEIHFDEGHRLRLEIVGHIGGALESVIRCGHPKEQLPVDRHGHVERSAQLKLPEDGRDKGLNGGVRRKSRPVAMQSGGFVDGSEVLNVIVLRILRSLGPLQCPLTPDTRGRGIHIPRNWSRRRVASNARSSVRRVARGAKAVAIESAHQFFASLLLLPGHQSPRHETVRGRWPTALTV